MRFRVLLSTTLVAGALALACGADATKPPVSGDATPSGGIGGSPNTNSTTADAGRPGTGVDGGACSAVTVGATQVAQNGVNDTVPAGTGGTIVNGIYDLITDDKYVGLSGLAGPTGIGTASTISINDTTFERVATQLSASNVTSSSNESGTLSVSGVNGVIALTCPLDTTTAITYTAGTDGTSLTFYDSAANEGRTYRLR